MDIGERIASLETSVDFILESMGKTLVKDMLDLFSSDTLLGHVFLAVDQSKDETTVTEDLQSKGIKTSLPTTHRRLKLLAEKRLIVQVPGGRGKRFVRHPKLEQVFRLSKRVEALLNKSG